MAYTYSKIASYTVGSGGVSAVSFLAIPQNYTDLIVKMSARTNTASSSNGQWSYINFNGATTNNLVRVLYGTGSTAGSLAHPSPTPYTAYVNPSDYTANTFGTGEIYIPNFTSSNFKSFSADGANENNAGAAGSSLTAGLWSSTAAINSIDITPGAGLFVQYSTFTLYGIKAEV